MGPPGWWFGMGLTTPQYKNPVHYKTLHKASDLKSCSCEHCNDPSGSVKGKEFLDSLSDY